MQGLKEETIMPVSMILVSAHLPWHSLYSLTDSLNCDPDNEEEEDSSRHLTPLQKLMLDMCHDEKTIKELNVGKRVGFYKVCGEIGCGNFSKVKLGFHALTKDKVAIKVLDKMRLDLQTQRMLSREISIMESLYHPNLLWLYEVLETSSRLYLVLEYAGGGDLHTRISTQGKLSDLECKLVFAQILSAVKHMHDNNIIHRDLKAENILYTSNYYVKVADFGFSTNISNCSQMLDTFCGSPPYAAPELFKDEAYMGPPVDLWAMGVLLFFMVTGTMPFRADTVPKLRRCVLQGVYVLPTWVSAPCQRLIRGILKPEPTERCALDQMLGCDWLLPVEILCPIPQLDQLNPVHLLKLGPRWAEQDEVHAALQELGVTEEHILNNQDKNSQSPLTGIYRIVLHRIQRNRGAECLPLITDVVKDPKRDSLRAYRIYDTPRNCVSSLNELNSDVMGFTCSSSQGSLSYMGSFDVNRIFET